MIEVKHIRVFDNVQGIHGFVGDARLVDESAGTHDTERGPLLNYDKAIGVLGDNADAALSKLGEAITEILCRDVSTTPG